MEGADGRARLFSISRSLNISPRKAASFFETVDARALAAPAPAAASSATSSAAALLLAAFNRRSIAHASFLKAEAFALLALIGFRSSLGMGGSHQHTLALAACASASASTTVVGAFFA